MSRLTAEERQRLIFASALREAWAAGFAATWLRRAEALEAAMSRPGDRLGTHTTAADVRARDLRLAAAARACRARATGADGLADVELVGAAADRAEEAIAC